MTMDIMVNQKLATFLDQHPKIEHGKHYSRKRYSIY